jgi:hypothetical protein
VYEDLRTVLSGRPVIARIETHQSTHCKRREEEEVELLRRVAWGFEIIGQSRTEFK